MTAETAVALPTLVLVLVAALWAIGLLGAQLACVDAARTGARAAARGEPIDAVRAAVARSAPAGAHIVISPGEDLTQVDVSLIARSRWTVVLPEIRVAASATAATEPGVGP